jgi:methyltransferase-like protein/2-polyprenyl-3-methyl-5-hydroxy-6-metoxy-1,4-benzoquinol methylase
MASGRETSYDQIPYQGQPFVQTHPDRLATVARLLGLDAPPVDGCRILELGCAEGGNLIPMAVSLPRASLLGVDLSGRQVATGKRLVEELGLKNIELRHASIADLDPSQGPFDYIICHGVYSWVPSPIQERILEICSQQLSRQGLAYVSYNTYPGWHLRGMVRDMLSYHARQFGEPAVQVQQARNLLAFLANSVTEPSNPYGAFLQDELHLIEKSHDGYVFHEHLEEVNEPLYFHQFVERAEAAGLQYLGEADFRVMAPANFPPEVQKVLQMLAADIIRLEQYMDFLRNRMFRQTLLCHADIHLSRRLRGEMIAGFYAASAITPVNQHPNLRSTEPEEFRTPDGLVFSVSQPLSKAALCQLSDDWPRYVTVADLRHKARRRLQAEGAQESGEAVDDFQILGQCLVTAYATASKGHVVDLLVSAPRHTLKIAEQPLGSPLARYQSASGNRVTNLRNETVDLDDLDRHVLLHLDGTRNSLDVVEMLVALVEQGSLRVDEKDRPVPSAARVRALLQSAVGRVLPKLATLALLIEP